MVSKFVILAVVITVVCGSPVTDILKRLIAMERRLNLRGNQVELTAQSTGSDLTTSERDEVLRLHNDARVSVNPPAAVTMQNLTWSSELASIAQDYADQCIWAHNSNRHSESSTYTYVGENLYATTVSQDIIENGINDWVSEKEDYDFEYNNCTAVCGHYTQVVWANTATVGCGITDCGTLTNIQSSHTTWQLFVCNYGPAGNVNGGRPYVEATTRRKRGLGISL